MDSKLTTTPAAQQSGECIIVAVYDKHILSPSATEIDKASGGQFSRLLKREDLRSGKTLLLHDISGIKAERVLLIQCGKQEALDPADFRKHIQTSLQALKGAGIERATSYLTELEVTDRDTHWKTRTCAELGQLAAYKFDQLKSEKDKDSRELRLINLAVLDKKEQAAAKRGLAEGNAIGQGMNLTRDLGNLPGNICTPTYLATEAKQLAKTYDKVSVKVLEEKDMEKLGMGSLLSVAKGSRQPPKLIILHYNGGKESDKPYALVGKGITFDSGGISIKPAATMDEMKFDMCGAASVLGTFKALGELKPHINVVGVIPTCENLPDGNANKPGDIVTSMSGQTIEVLNTDAEGRLILCDALTYTERFKPKAVIDIATLTGACVVALGKHACGLLANDDDLAKELLDAGQVTHDRAWQLPLWEDYQEQLKSNFADMANIGGPQAGTITAACFLARFTKKFKWAHLDIAGVAWDSGANKGATGRPVPLLTQYLLSHSKR